MRHNYEHLEVYQRSMKLASQILSVVDDIRPYRLGEQIAASSVSVPSNIAEGAERGTNKEFARFLSFSSGSTAELITQLKLLQLSNKAKGEDVEAWILEAKEINSMIRGLMLTLEKKG